MQVLARVDTAPCGLADTARFVANLDPRTADGSILPEHPNRHSRLWTSGGGREDVVREISATRWQIKPYFVQ